MLRDIQLDIVDALFSRSSRAEQHVCGGPLGAARRLAVYRHNLIASLGDALAAVHPTVQAVVGEAFFARLARDYLHAHPSRSGNLHDFGDALAEFIEGYPPVAALPYLADCARLDWAWHEVFHAGPLPPLDAGAALARLAALPEALRGSVRLALQPASRLVASRWPVFSIWKLDPDDPESPEVDLDAGGEQVLVLQRDGVVEVEPLSAAEHALLVALRRGDTLGQAFAAALAVGAADDSVQLPALLAHHLQRGTLVALQLAG